MFNFLLVLLTNLDTTAPIIVLNSTIPASVTKGDSYNIIESYTKNNPSGSNVNCSSDLDINKNIININQLTILGNHTITCTITTGAGKSISVTKNITITYQAYAITNLIRNGSFEEGIDEWENRNLNKEYSSGNYSSLGIQKYGNNTFRIKFNENDQDFSRANYPEINTLKNHKIYAKVSTLRESSYANPGIYVCLTEGAEMWSEPATCLSNWYDANNSDIPNYQWVDLSVYINSSPYNYLKIMLAQASINNVKNAIIHFDGLLVIDLTSVFGSGNEPDQEWCDNHINYFDGTTTIYK